ncbi:hypothetical protein HZ326_29350, partial [Fusarium oxysporum f. sp. albedinis]
MSETALKGSIVSSPSPSPPPTFPRLGSRPKSIAKHVPCSPVFPSLTRDNILSLKKAAVREELDEAVTQIHISFDLWTSPNRLAFISIFGHFIDQSNSHQSRLLAFRRQIGSHAGENIAYTVGNVVRDWGIDRKIGV